MARTKPPRAISFDVHGMLVEKKSPAAVRQHITRSYEHAIALVTHSSLELDPQFVARAKIQIEFRTPRHSRKGVVLTENEFFLRTRVLLLREILRKYAPQLLPLGSREEMVIAKSARAFHRDDRDDFFMHSDVRTLVNWAIDVKLDICINSGQSAENVIDILARNRFPVRAIKSITTTKKVNSSKMLPQFWEQVARDAKCDPQELVIVGDNAVQETMATQCGSPVLIQDRDGFYESVFYDPEVGQDIKNRLRGTLILKNGVRSPPSACFVEFHRNAPSIRARLEEMLDGIKS